MLFRKDVGNGILLDRPLPFKLHQSYRPLPCFIPALQEIWSGPAKNSAVMAVMAVMTSTPRLASHYRGEAVMRLSSQPYVHPFITTVYPSSDATSSRIMHHVTKLKSSQTGFLNMTMSSLYSNGLHSHQISIQWSTFGMWWNRRFASCMCSRQICSNCVMLSCQYGPKSLRNVSNTLLNLYHEELRQF